MSFFSLVCRSCIVCLLLQSFVWATFPDIQDHQYHDSITYLQAQEVIKGYPDGTFGPERGVTRAEMLKIILKAKLEKEELGDATNCFRDVVAQRYAPYVCYAKEQKIVRGYPDETFKPDQAVTIAEGLKIALETFDQPVDETNDERWFEPYIDFVHSRSLFSKHSLQPNRPMTRAEMSYLVHQLLLEQQGEITFSTTHVDLSPGCEEKQLPKKAPTTSVVRGEQRSYITAIGKKVKAQKPTKLIVAFHGRTSPNREVRQYYGLEKAWDQDAIIVYPSGLPEGGPSRSRRAPGDTNETVRGFELFDTIVKEFSDNYCLDLDEIYAVGHSLGAWFTNSLACARGDILRAAGSVGGSTTANTCSGPVASIIMHNPNDRLASFAGGIAARDQRLEQNNCGPETKPVGPTEGNCVEYTNCISGTPVIRCPHTQDHARWDGSYYPHTRPDFAGKMIWEFIEEQE